jgi:hypothetical protein
MFKRATAAGFDLFDPDGCLPGDPLRVKEVVSNCLA